MKKYLVLFLIFLVFFICFFEELFSEFKNNLIYLKLKFVDGIILIFFIDIGGGWNVILWEFSEKYGWEIS